MSTGNLYIISAPSGAGKTSLVKKLIADIDHLVLSISHTTRPIRPGEAQGRDYYFSDRKDFQHLIDNQALLEHALVFDHYYGTAKTTVEDNLNQGLDVVLEIDWQGAEQIKQLCPESIAIFILPPSIAVLEQRLRHRGQDDEHVIARRMRDAVNEMSHYHEYDYIVVNEDFEQACIELKSIIIANRLTQKKQLVRLRLLLAKLHL